MSDIGQLRDLAWQKKDRGHRAQYADAQAIIERLRAELAKYRKDELLSQQLDEENGDE